MDETIKKVAFGFSVLFIFVSFFGVIMSYRAFASYGWDSTTGVVDQSDYRISSKHNEYFKFSYSYQVNGITYSSGNINVDGLITYQDSYDQSIIEHSRPYYAKLYPVNATVTVYYDPLNPSNAALVKGLSEDHFGYAVWSCLIWLSGIVSVLYISYKKTIFSLESTLESILVYFSCLAFASLFIESIINSYLYSILYI